MKCDLHNVNKTNNKKKKKSDGELQIQLQN